MESNKYTITTLRSGHIVKILPNDVETYKIIRVNFIENNVSHYTYQLKSEKAYRVVLRGLHASEDIMFFVDLEPKYNNTKILKVTGLNNVKVFFEAPYKKQDILQCKSCQRFGHARNHCHRPFRCVKCGEVHSTTSCLKRPDTEATCENCQEKHPASHKGCTKYKRYKELLFKNQPKREKIQMKTQKNTQTNTLKVNPKITRQIMIRTNDNRTSKKYIRI